MQTPKSTPGHQRSANDRNASARAPNARFDHARDSQPDDNSPYDTDQDSDQHDTDRDFDGDDASQDSLRHHDFAHGGSHRSGMGPDDSNPDDTNPDDFNPDDFNAGDRYPQGSEVDSEEDHGHSPFMSGARHSSLRSSEAEAADLDATSRLTGRSPSAVRTMSFRQWADQGWQNRATIMSADASDPGQVPLHLKVFIASVADHIGVGSGGQGVGGQGRGGRGAGRGRGGRHNGLNNGRGKGGRGREADSQLQGRDGHDADAGDGENGDAAATPGRPKPNKPAQYQWGAIRNTADFELPAPILDHIRSFGNGAIRFFSDTEPIGSDLEGSESEENRGLWRYKLAVRWDYMEDCESRLNGMDPARRVSHYLLIRDLVRLIDPNASTRRPTRATWRAFSTLLRDISYQRETIRPADAAGKLWQRFKFGEKLHHLNNEFGSGAAFVLCKKLSPDFLEHKSPPSHHRDFAYLHLRSNPGFLAAVKQANALAQNVREFLIQPIREAYIKAGLAGAHADPTQDDDQDDLEEVTSSEVKRIDREAIGFILEGVTSPEPGKDHGHVRRGSAQTENTPSSRKRKHRHFEDEGKRDEDDAGNESDRQSQSRKRRHVEDDEVEKEAGNLDERGRQRPKHGHVDEDKREGSNNGEEDVATRSGDTLEAAAAGSPESAGKKWRTIFDWFR